MEKFNFEKKFSSPQEELSYLKEYISKKEKILEGGESDIEDGIKNTVESYGQNSPEEVLQKGAVIPETFRNEIVLKLKPEEHDAKMGELISIVYEKGIINALSIVLKLDDPHLTDDFHRFLVQYLKEGYDLTGLQKETPLEKNLRRTLFEVALSYDRNNSDDSGDVKKFFEIMEQFYFGMMSVTDSKKSEYLSIEIANSIGSREFIFYISIPENKTELLEKQLVSVFPNATITEQKDDFNVFNAGGFSVGANVLQSEVPVKVIRDHENFNIDPMGVLLNVFSKLDETKEAACIQLIFKPVGDFYLKNYNKGLKKVNKGAKSAEEFHTRNTFSSKLATKITTILSLPEKKDKNSSGPEDQKLVENINKKISFPIVSTNIRIVASAENEIRANAILNDIESAFNQFENTTGNKFKFEEVDGRKKRNFFREFSFREFDSDYDVPLNIREVSTIMHFPSSGSSVSPELKTNKMKTASAPITVSREGIYLGFNKHRNTETPIYFSKEDRLRHFYIIGQTGTGKTTILKNMIIQDIKNGDGVCMIDPHGSDIQDILANVPKERYEDVIYFDPSYPDRVMALNMLEYDRQKPEQKTFVVNELFSIFQKLYGDANPESMGPMFEQYFRNATMLVIDDPETGSTLLDVSRVLADKNFRELKLSRCKNPIVIQFWREIATKAGGEASLENIVPYITSKFDVFLANDIMRPVIAQEKSSFNFRDIMDNKKILLVNLSKGSLGDINSSLIGLILVGKILMAALSRSDSKTKNYPPFYLYIDEFQNITTDSISTILSEARKYKLSLNIAHQFIAQLNEGIRDSVFGNVGSMAVYRVGSEDAEFLEKQLTPVFTAKDIMNIDNFNCYLKMLSKGVPIDSFNVRVPPPEAGNIDQVDSLKKLSYLKYGQDRKMIEDQILQRYQKTQKNVI
ncbi:MAG TPA: type IV secretion system DNA-binding domain-containing protein [Candidatus Paceibacterota bacterium]|nr:type IV secretion system DNA-binding domain-containing protein [Candidatus Paceibacterota bacterium]HMP19138.1 type IV secretion system DNA-binding domain-containing protein [Candidatus Paceibacterota bacterium]HMP85153.1 type IV secretion system DNA-binding domain-containing protein [Candidatus Paceibacterota bacterium]